MSGSSVRVASPANSQSGCLRSELAVINSHGELLTSFRTDSSVISQCEFPLFVCPKRVLVVVPRFVHLLVGQHAVV